MDNLFENESELRRRGARDISCANFRRVTRRFFKESPVFPEGMPQAERDRQVERSIRGLERTTFALSHPDRPEHPWVRAYFSYMLHQLLCERCRAYREQYSKKVLEELRRYIESLREKQDSQAS